MRTILVIDDNPAVGTALDVLFGLRDIRALIASSPEEGLAMLERNAVDLVVQDMNFARNQTSGEEGIALFRAVRRLDPDVPLLLMTAFSSLETAVALVKEGAADYIAKPWNDERLVKTVENLLRIRRLELENTRLKLAAERERKLLAERYDLRGLVYESAEMRSLVSLAVHVAPSDAPVLADAGSVAGRRRAAAAQADRRVVVAAWAGAAGAVAASHQAARRLPWRRSPGH